LLNLIPFAACYCPERGKYLAETHTITVVPSLTTWSLIAPKAIASPTVLVVGSSRIGGEIGILPHTISEAIMVADTFTDTDISTDTIVLLEDEATVHTVIAYLSQADLIYFAAHGEYAPGDPAASFLELADGPLRVADILPLKLKATTVILNACETNRGLLRGNEMMGLVRAFLYAGAQSVIATHWPIDDAAGHRLMAHFMEAIRHGELPTTALRAAQCAMIHGSQEKYRHPFFWGGQQMVGRIH
ncbi:MAG: CHAT domain-containing protein, partial [Caldilineaceae bacterium]|nr:CHAT domain-containing protein [Caldilineaceae bacterium]